MFRSLLSGGSCGTSLLNRNAFFAGFRVVSRRRDFTSTAVARKYPEHVVVALGGNALLHRGEEMTMANQRKNIRQAAENLKDLCLGHPVTLVHGNGPQVGLLSLQTAAYSKGDPEKAQPLDVLDAESEGMIGYMIEQELDNVLKKEKMVCTLLTQVVVDPEDPAFKDPTKFVGPVYSEEGAEALRAKGLPVKQDGKYWRRVVPSPKPVRVIEQQLAAIRLLTNNGAIVICAGGGGIPVIHDKESLTLSGVEAVVDKDRAACMLAKELRADGLLILTDVGAVALDWGTPNQKDIKSASPQKMRDFDFPAGSMGPKVEACCNFVQERKGWAAIGPLSKANLIAAGKAGTRVTLEHGPDHIEYY